MLLLAFIAIVAWLGFKIPARGRFVDLSMTAGLAIVFVVVMVWLITLMGG